MKILVTIGSGVSEGAGVEFPTFPLTCVVVLKTLWHYRASVWLTCTTPAADVYRFRSIAKSYFRRADGVLLLYDVTYERSFINVRDWLEAIEVRRRLCLLLFQNNVFIYFCTVQNYKNSKNKPDSPIRRSDG